ncbi:MAG TPA: TraB/GumN family protein, partial [Cytophagales bacterium]|nr:TraB/GumN family protein [Cytophagales bacterium]
MTNKYLFTLLFCGTTAFSQNNNTYKLLWKVTSKNKSAKPSYLFGTMHVSDKRVFRFSDSLLPALQQSEAFAGELDYEGLLPKLVDLIYLKKQSRIKQEMSTADYQILDEKIQNTFGAPFDSINNQDTWIYDIFLKRKSQTSYNKDKETLLDAYLGGLAAQQKKTILGLETLEEYSAWNNRLTDKQKAHILLSLVKDKELEQEEQPEHLDTTAVKDLLMQLYTKGDIETMHKIFMDSSQLGSQFLFTSMHFRNVNMVTRMDSIMKKQSLFAAVGALHLGGDSGMIKLLQAKGYTVTPVYATFNSKKKLPELVKRDYSWSEFTPPNSTFNVLMPMKPFKVPIPTPPGIELQAFISLDLSKMYVFMCMTLKLGAVIPTDKEEDLMNNMVQNMALQSKSQVVSKQFFASGSPRRMEAILKKRKEYSKLTLFHHEGEVLILMLNGNKDHIYGDDARKFSTSVKRSNYVAPKTELVPYVDKGKGFSLLMPSVRKESVRNIESEEANIRMAMHYNSTPIDGISYYLAIYDYEDGMYITDAKYSVDAVVEGLSTKLPGWTLTSSDTTVDQCIAKQYTMVNKASGTMMRGKLLVRDNRMVMFWCSGDKAAMDKGDAKLFLNSFKIQPYPTHSYAYQYAPDSSYKVRLGTVSKVDTLEDYNAVEDYMPPANREYYLIYNDSITTTRYSIIQCAFK